MTLLFAVVVGVLFGSGVYLMLKADLFRVIVGMVLVSNAANLTLMAAGLSRGQEPNYPLRAGQPVSDPLVQAMTLTAIVIGFAVTALLLSLAFRVYTTQDGADLDAISRAETTAEIEAEARIAAEPEPTERDEVSA
ncbi:MAG: NADH-quinone oxidoreductase subunit K [Solirubrobacterales bacterium]|nr:NADH-quinone oxidoreductase subunit K [Solirubrobacterales bacterium]